MKLSKDISKIKKDYRKFKNSKKLLDLTRGRPSSEQLDLSDNLETIMKGDFIQDKVDTRNYGLLEGLPSARKLAGWVLNSNPANILVNGTSSLTLLGHYLSQFFQAQRRQILSVQHYLCWLCFERCALSQAVC